MDRMTEWLITGERPLPFFLTSFAKAASGGKSKKDDGDDDDDDDDGGDDSDDDDDDDEDDDLADMTDEELREALKEERAKVTRASERAARRRKREKKAREDAAAKKSDSKPKEKGGDDDEDLESARERARAEGESAGLTRAKKAEAKSSLLAAGVNPARVARAVGLLDLDELDLDDEGLDGIEDAIDELKKEWPELFAKKRTRRGSVAGDGDRNGDKSRRKEMTPSQRQAAIATGRR